MKTSMNKVVSFDIPIISKEEAKAKGLKRFFTGVPCPSKGHISERLVSNGGCCECNRLGLNRRRRGEELETIERVCKSDKCNNKFEVKVSSNQIYCSTKCCSYFTSKLERTLFPEKTRAANNKCFKKHGAKYNFKRAGKREIIPTVLTKVEFEKGVAKYQRMLDLNAQANPNEREKRKYCVDHIIPLSIGGRHHPNNLEVITLAENSKKREFVENPDWNDPEYRIAKRRFELGIYKRNV